MGKDILKNNMSRIGKIARCIFCITKDNQYGARAFRREHRRRFTETQFVLKKIEEKNGHLYQV
jgi:hypothetical protein